MESIKALIKCFPSMSDIEFMSEDEHPESIFIFEKCLTALKDYEEDPSTDLEYAAFLATALTHRYWEQIHCGYFYEVPISTRRLYSLGCYFKIVLDLLRNHDQKTIQECFKTFDMSLLLGYAPNPPSNDLSQGIENFFQEHLVNAEVNLPKLQPLARKKFKCDIIELDCPSLEAFKRDVFDQGVPALLLNTINHWPALTKWRDLKYLLKVAGNRTVPIEIGVNYAADEWSQQLFQVKDFLRRQFTYERFENGQNIEYLAQHDLFDQIPELRADICTPDYCCVSDLKDPIQIKAWLGPKGTISPMHFDKKHNILCQVFGMKTLILAAPEEFDNLYPHSTQFLCNTSQVDASNIDFKRFPDAKNVKFYNVTLQEGDCIYMPPYWWHYVRSESPSFSVSFWW